MDADYGRFQILSLDGGGIKGLFSAAVLSAIEEDLDIRVADHFDLITGTSTGGIRTNENRLFTFPADPLRITS